MVVVVFPLYGRPSIQQKAIPDKHVLNLNRCKCVFGDFILLGCGCVWNINKCFVTVLNYVAIWVMQ